MIRIEKWSQEALSHRQKMSFDLEYVDSKGRVTARFCPSYLEIDPDDDNETRHITAYGTYHLLVDMQQEEEIFGKLEIELSEYIKVESEYIDYYLNRTWDNYIVYDSNVLDFLDSIKFA